MSTAEAARPRLCRRDRPRHAFAARHRLANPAAPALPRKKLPVGIQTLAKLRCQGCCYVDKSGLAIDLIESGSYFFLSRPRRLGKSRILSTAHLESEARMDCHAID